MRVGEAAVESLQVVSFEEAAAALAAVETVHGESHPLVQPTGETDRVDISLWDELHKPDDAEPHAFDGKDAVIIKGALEEIAKPDSSSPYKATARLMINTLLDDSEPLEKPSEGPEILAAAPNGPTAETPGPPKVLQPTPRSVKGEIVDGHVKLRTFGHLVTALNAVKDCAEGDDRQAAIDRIRGEIDRVDPFNTGDVFFWGSCAETIHKSLVGAAAKGEGTSNKLAAHILREAASEPMPDPATATAEELQRPLSLVT